VVCRSYRKSAGGPSVGTLAKDEIVEVLQRITDSKDKVKIQHERGWTPLLSPTGASSL
jgi:hypothetical protein